MTLDRRSEVSTTVLPEQIPSTLQAVVYHGPEDYRLEAVPVPPRGPGEVLNHYHGAPKFWGDANRPASGLVVQLDDEAAAHWGITVSDRVVDEQLLPDWTCRYCLEGAYHMCVRHDMYGFKLTTPGAMASYKVFTTDSLVHTASGDLLSAHAAFTEPPSAVGQGLNLLRKLDRYVEYSVFGSDISVDKELDVSGTHLGPHCWPPAIGMIESGALAMNRLCTHQLPLAEFQQGLDLVASGKESIKVSLIP